MGEVSHYPHGTFCWVDLATPNLTGAKSFYSALFGWDTSDIRADRNNLVMCRLDGGVVAGIHEAAEGEPAGWGTSIAVDDAEKATARAEELGATVLLPPVELPEGGRGAGIQDPAGAVVMLWQLDDDLGSRLVNEFNTWTWNELVTPNLDAAREFYTRLFGWQAEDLPGPLERVSFTMNGLIVGGAHKPAPGEGDASTWTVAFRAADTDASVARVRELGGSVLMPPIDIPIGRLAIVADPAGASFNLTSWEGGSMGGLDTA